MAEHRIPVQMEIIGIGETDAAAQADAQRQYLEIVAAFNGSYSGETEPLADDGVPTNAAVLFTRLQINHYISEVVIGWRRRKAQEAAILTVSVEGVIME